MARRDEGAWPPASVTEEQRSQRAFSVKTLRAADLLAVAGVGSAVTARCGDAPSSPQHRAAREFIESVSPREDVALSEFVLAEFYLLLRNPAVLADPLTAPKAVAVIQSYRQHPRWRTLGFPPASRELHAELWRKCAQSGIDRRRIYDMRTALALRAFGVTEFATANVKDFEGFGFERVWNPNAP